MIQLVFNCQLLNYPSLLESADVSHSDPLNGFSITNPSVADFREYISFCYQLQANDLVFINLNHIQTNLTDDQTIKEAFFVNPSSCSGQSNRNSGSNKVENLIDSMCIMELNCPSSVNKSEPHMPLINIIGINVYYEGSEAKRLVCYGLPFVLLINRDCSYSELCRKLLEAQSKYFKEKVFFKLTYYIFLP